MNKCPVSEAENRYQETLRDDIPLGYTYDEKGNVLTFKDSNGYWSEYTYDEKGNKLTRKDSNGYWCEYTYDEKGNKLTRKDSNGYWCEYTYDEKGNVLTFKDSDGFWCEYTRDENGNELTYKNSDIKDGELFTRIAFDNEYKLFTNEAKDYFIAGCRKFTKQEAVDHWGNDKGGCSKRAELFLKTIKEL